MLSSGFDYYIRRILACHGCGAPVTANGLSFTEEGEVRLCSLDNDVPGCDLYKPPCIGCKPEPWAGWKEQGYRIAFVGDGVSDYCLAERWDRLPEPDDLLFPKRKLLHFCRERAVPAIALETLADVAVWLRRRGGCLTKGPAG